ncbi:DUF2145 domain-containing protein [Pseudoduganella danionis]|uniref:DUF2145 domain-containing protein n=1 Tax=Pseudoduganella danionis TaxID=1890295 RepID=A0ABW9SMG0_9BURK|nr:DUF2145 domain-containing protein [Pseudoduganella danionis]MTW32840.1 DUF2145 domain-containing protein [Pseudoduganella danionis]
MRQWAAGLLLAGTAAAAQASTQAPDAAFAPAPVRAGRGSGASHFCDRSQALSAIEQDRLLRFAAALRDELGEDDDIVLLSRSGLDLSRFAIRYSHAALAWRSAEGRWSARQLYYACDEGRPRIYDQGLAGFALGTDDPALGFVSLVRMPAQASTALRPALLDASRVQHLLAASYSANAYAYSVQYQNCNQWVVEMLAAGWADLADGEDLRLRAQAWLAQAVYAPQPVEVGSRWLMLASAFVPLLHLDDHPPEARSAMRLQVSLPVAIEQFVQQRFPGSSRVELCHDEHQIVVHRGWSPVAAGCVAGPDDRVIPLAD